MQATMESIRASLEHDYPTGEFDTSDYATAFQEMDSTGSLLQRLVSARGFPPPTRRCPSSPMARLG